MPIFNPNVKWTEEVRDSVIEAVEDRLKDLTPDDENCLLCAIYKDDCDICPLGPERKGWCAAYVDIFDDMIEGVETPGDIGPLDYLNKIKRMAGKKRLME